MKKMPLMTDFESGDVVLVEVIFAEGTDSKKRPALIISSSNYHKHRKEVIIAAITSNIARKLYGDTKIEKWEEAGLLYPSIVTSIVQTVKKDMIIRKLGRLSVGDFKKVKANLKKSICL